MSHGYSGIPACLALLALFNLPASATRPPSYDVTLCAWGHPVNQVPQEATSLLENGDQNYDYLVLVTLGGAGGGCDCSQNHQVELLAGQSTCVPHCAYPCSGAWCNSASVDNPRIVALRKAGTSVWDYLLDPAELVPDSVELPYTCGYPTCSFEGCWRVQQTIGKLGGPMREGDIAVRGVATCAERSNGGTERRAPSCGGVPASE